MKKLLLLLMIAPVFGQNILVSDFDTDFGIKTLMLNNGNRLVFAPENLDNNTADSDCQCENIYFGNVLWVFEVNNSFEIIKQKCFKREDLQQFFYFYEYSYDGGTRTETMFDLRGLWTTNGNAPNVSEIYYVNDEIEVDFGGVLLKFDLQTYSFSEPIYYRAPVRAKGVVVDKIIHLNENHLMFMYYDNYQEISNSAAVTYSKDVGFQNFIAREAKDWFGRLEYSHSSGTSFLNIDEIFDTNQEVVILDYKKNSENKVAFLIVTNALDGIYTDGIPYQTSLFLIEVDFTDIGNLNYNVVKSNLEIPRNTDLSYGGYNVSINEENNFVINVKPKLYDTDSWDFYNYVHILKDNGDFETISLENEYFIHIDVPGTSYRDPVKFWIGNSLNYTDGYHSQPQTHEIIDMVFSEDTFMTMEQVQNFHMYPNQFHSSQSYIFKLFDYNGTVLFRHVFPGFNMDDRCCDSTIEIDDRFVTRVFDNITYLHGGSLNADNFYGLKFNEISGYYSIDTNPKDAYGFTAYGTTYPSYQFSFENIPLSSIEYKNNTIKFNLSYNPVFDKLIIDGKNNFDLSVLNSLGQLLIEAEKTNTIDVSSLSKGVYFIKASDGTNSYTKKFIKN